MPSLARSAHPFPLPCLIRVIDLVVQIDRIDPKYLATSSRVKLGEETRIKATVEEVSEWEKQVAQSGGEIFVSTFVPAWFEPTHVTWLTYYPATQ